MIETHDELYRDFEAIKSIPIVPTMLEVICRTTGMGFATIARVTDGRWLACSVRDEVAFGLAEGGELKIETTICNEIREHQKPVIIDHVDADNDYRDHPTPKMYGLQSYISVPIILKDGSFFGTLCAIDSRPAQLNNAATIGLFTLFVDLISFHLQSISLMERSTTALQETNRMLHYSNNENMLYQKISDHNLQEPLRKIRLFSDLLINHTTEADAKVKSTALKINSFAEELNSMMRHVTKFSAINDAVAGEHTDLNAVVAAVCNSLKASLADKNISVQQSMLPAITAVPAQMSELFSQLLIHAITFSKNEKASVISIYAEEPTTQEVKAISATAVPAAFCKIIIEQNGVGTDRYTLKSLFDIFMHLDETEAAERYKAGLAYCRKIVHNHGGTISAHSAENAGITFCILLPK